MGKPPSPLPRRPQVQDQASCLPARNAGPPQRSASGMGLSSPPRMAPTASVALLEAGEGGTSHMTEEEGERPNHGRNGNLFFLKWVCHF